VSSAPGVLELHAGFGFAEGPVCLPDGTIAFCDGTNGVVLGFRDGHVRVIGTVGGAPNGLTLGLDGALYVTQMGSWLSGGSHVAPCIQRLKLDGSVTVLATDGDGVALVAPNDLAFGPDGRLYFTDSGDSDHVNPIRPGRLFAVSNAAVELILELEPCFANGIGFDAFGRLLWTETATRRVCRLEDDRVVVLITLPEGHIPDGFAIAGDGRIFVATVTSGGITVLSPDGELIDHLAVGAEPTNCAFDGSTLVVTAYTPANEPHSGHLLSLETDAIGLTLHSGQLLAPSPG
jgi:gluconolactonase